MKQEEQVDLIRIRKGDRVIEIKPMHEPAYREMGYAREGVDKQQDKPDASASKTKAGA